MELKKKLKMIIGSIVVGVLGLTVVVSADSEHEIEQVSVNMPDVTAYYRSTPQEQQPTAYLESNELTLISNSVFSKIPKSAKPAEPTIVNYKEYPHSLRAIPQFSSTSRTVRSSYLYWFFL